MQSPPTEFFKLIDYESPSDGELSPDEWSDMESEPSESDLGFHIEIPNEVSGMGSLPIESPPNWDIELLPTELLYLIATMLDTGSRASLCRTNRYLQNVVQPLVFEQFKDSAFDQNEDNWKKLEKFYNVIQHNGFGEYVQSISIIHIQVEKFADILIPLLSRTPNLKSLALYASREYFNSIVDFLKKKSLSLSKLQWLCSDHPSGIRKPIRCLPQITSLAADYCSRAIQLPDHMPRSLERITFRHSDLSEETINTLFNNTSQLRSFKYMAPFQLSQLDAERLSMIFAEQKALEELCIQFPRQYYFRIYNHSEEKRDYNSIPKMSLLEEMSSLSRMIIDQGILSKRPCLPSTLQTLVITNSHWSIIEHLEYLAQESRSSLSALEFIYIYGVKRQPQTNQLPQFTERVKLHICDGGCDDCRKFFISLYFA